MSLERRQPRQDHFPMSLAWPNCLASIVPLTLLLLVRLGYTASLQYRIDYRRSYLVLLGDTINLTCPYTTPFYKWTPSAQTSWILSEDQVYSLKAESLSVSGRYICSAVNGFGHNSAEFNIKVIDKFSPALEQSCALLSNGHVSKSGPCFLNTYTEPELVLNKVWGEDTILDCESVAVESLTDRITYTWEFYHHPQTSTTGKAVMGGGGSSSNPALLPAETASVAEANDAFIVQRLPRISPSPPGGGVPEKAVKASHEEIVARFTGPILQFRKVTLSHAGEYRCTVSVNTVLRTNSNVGDGTSEPKIGKLMRTFRLRVQSRSEGDIIQGAHNITATVERGSDATFTCEISKEEHRSATIRWGKYITPGEADTSEFHKNELLHWSGGTYVVLPTIPPQDLQKLFDVWKPLAVSNLGSKKSRLVLRSASPRDAGLYVCSVITESGRDDHKFVHVNIKDDDMIEMPADQKNATPRKLTIYIAVPICVFLICFCAVISLIIRNRGRRNRQPMVNQRSQKFFLSQGKLGMNSSNHYLDHSSLAGSNSMGFSRSGSPRVRSVPSNVDRPAGHLQLRPSPVSTCDTSTQQVPSSISPNHLHSMQYLYPSSATECAYFTPDGSSQYPMAYGAVPYGPTPTPAQPNNFMKRHMGGVEYPHFSAGGMHHPPPNSNLPMACNGGPQQSTGSGSSGGLKSIRPGFQQCSVESSACTDLGFDQPSPPFSTTHYNLSSQEPEGRVLCVSPSSGPESTKHLRNMQITDSESA